MPLVKVVFWKGKFIFQGEFILQRTLPFNGKTKVLSGVWNQDLAWDECTRNNQCTSATLYTNWKLQLCRQCCQILTQSQQKNQAFSSIPSEHSIQPSMYLLLELCLLQRDFKYVLRSSLLIQNLTLTRTHRVAGHHGKTSTIMKKLNNAIVKSNPIGLSMVPTMAVYKNLYPQDFLKRDLVMACHTSVYSKNKGKCHYTSSVPFKEEGCHWCKVRLCTGSTHGSTETSIHQ